MVDQILNHHDGVIGITDDGVIHGKDDEHNRGLHKWMALACEHGLVFNSRKCIIKQPSMTFFGCLCDKNGAHPDPAKVSAVHNMPPSETPTQLQTFLSMAIYL